MPLPPSRRDTTGPPPRDISDLSRIVRHHDSYLRQLDPGLQGGRWATPRPVPGGRSQIVGGDGGGDDSEIAWEWDDRHTVTAAGAQLARLSHVPIEESLFVRWHPGGNGGLPWTSEYFSVTDQMVTITDPGFLATGDTFSFQYQYEVDDDVVELEFVAYVPGVFQLADNTMTFTPPGTMQPGDFLVAAIRGTVAPGGGDISLGATSLDSRLAVVYTATPTVRETVMTGFATASTADVVTYIIPDPSFTPSSAQGGMFICRGVNGIGPTAALETGGTGLTGTTPQVPGVGAIAVTWDGNHSFTILASAPPSGYTEGGNTGSAYSATDISYWFDPEGSTSPAGTFVGQGCLVIGLI